MESHEQCGANVLCFGGIMIYLLLALVTSASITIFMRLSENYMNNQMGMFMANYATCSVLSYLYVERGNEGLFGSSPVVPVLLGIITGTLYLVNFVFMKYNMKYNGVILTTIFSKLGVMVPTLMAILIFHEAPRMIQIIGIILAVISIIVIHFEKDAVYHSNHKFWLILLLVLSGLANGMLSVYEEVGDSGGKDGYLLMIFVVAFLLSAVGAAVEKKNICKADIFFGILIGVPNYFSSRFLLLALGSVDAMLAYPIFSVGSLLVVTVAGVLLFKESLSRQKAIALGMIAAALCLLNM